MPALPGPETSSTRPAKASPPDASIHKPPLPTLPTSRFSQQQPRAIEVQLPPLIAGALSTAFAAAVADGLGNALLAHYYLPEQKVRLNLDRVVDRLIARFNADIWDELFAFYDGLADVPARQVVLLFEGPVRQLVLVLNGPETAQCVLEMIGPGLSRRSPTWSTHARGIDLSLALQLLCNYWQREFASRWPGGNPEGIAQVLHGKVINSQAAQNLIASIRQTLLSPHHVQMHIMESAIWDIILKKPSRPPPDGFHVLQFKFDCQLFGPHAAIGDPQLVRISALPAITGTVTEQVNTTVVDYTLHRWPRSGEIVLSCLEEALGAASDTCRQGGPFSGMSIWDASDGKGSFFSAGLRLLHVEVEEASIRLSVSARTHTLIAVLQQMAWTCAALSASPFPGSLSESAVEVSGWEYLDDSVLVNCGLTHQSVAETDGSVPHIHGAAIARGFPVDEC